MQDRRNEFVHDNAGAIHDALVVETMARLGLLLSCLPILSRILRSSRERGNHKRSLWKWLKGCPNLHTLVGAVYVELAAAQAS
jgi:hypothetical protein